VACATLVGLIFLCVAWELVLAPVRPGGSWLVLKVVPLLFALFGVLRGRRYTFQWTTLMIWLYFTEGVVRGWSDRGLSARLGLLEITLSLAYFVSAIAFIRGQRRA
jgi:uncharacterized membrane protein